ncbi:uncharacterized protein B0H64DRAFT_401058 [Chaetomium fimeti]|uniref:Peptidase S7 domain-containing protein n=1 Tax=Chaetomium fimeti TaxID=1854472 RepID=A0AAE0HE30_9PEZI|nr:hypothetical protein B0H64DRAFT_401058 [Chaetomium fimeti]
MRIPHPDGIDTLAVFKCGRSTGKTRGELNRIHSSIRMRYEFDYGDEVIIKGKGLVVVAPPQYTRSHDVSSYSVDPFGRKGDSGSLVFNYEGKIIGIYIGGQDDDDPSFGKHLAISGIHFVSPIGPNLDAIRAAVQDDPSFGGAPVDVEFLWGHGSVDGHAEV